MDQRSQQATDEINQLLEQRHVLIKFIKMRNSGFLVLVQPMILTILAPISSNSNSPTSEKPN
jgi:hypothetical protein